MARPARDFPFVSAAIPDAEIRALFTQRFLAATEIYDELVDAACWKLLGDVGARPAPGEEKDEEILLAQYPVQARPAIQYMIEKLTDAEYFLRRSSGAPEPGTTSTPLEAGAPLTLQRNSSDSVSLAARQPGSIAALAAELAADEPDAAVGGELVSLLAEEGAAFLRGEKTGEEILFSPTRLPLWIRYFSNANILYAINNTLGAEALVRTLPPAAVVLEIGGGCGSAAEAALARLAGRVARWRFTELVPTFARPRPPARSSRPRSST